MSAQPTPLPHRNLDVLRSIAVLLVLADHLGIAVLPNRWRGSFAVLGGLGVLLFFVHTSLVLMSSLERHGERPGWVRTFYVRRAFRIYPLAIVAIGLVLVLRIHAGIPHVGRVAPFTFPPPSTVIANFALVQNLAARPDVLVPLWSLPIEVEMYVLLPWCWIVARQRLPQMAALLAGLLAAFGIVAYAPIPFVWRFTVFLYGPCFFAGVFAYFLLRRRVRAILPPWTVYAVIAAGAAFLFAFRPGEASALDAIRSWVPSLLVGGLLPFIREREASRVTTAAKQVATYSYGLYLLHIPALWVAFVVLRHAPGAVEGMVFVVSLTGMVWLAYHGIEAPLVRLGQRIASGRGAAPALEVAPAP